jgi:predicted AAA+ superfamily ATPase
MKIIPRQITATCLQDLKTFPVLTLTGPRQSGKSTLLRGILPDWAYINLEEPHNMQFAIDDPKGFISSYGDKVIIDEIQRAPKLISYIQSEVDRDRRPGRFAITGSHNLLLLEQVSQSLAGRTAVRHLLPFSNSELNSAGIAPGTVEDAIFRGGYPLVHAHLEAGNAWLDSYIQTYVERDVRMIRNVSDLGTFRRFIKLCAGRSSQLLDLSGIGGDTGISHNTVRQWIGILEAGFIAFRLEPYFENFSKRIIKSPKLYFYDTGVLCRLLDIRNAVELASHPFRGAVFENWCVVEAMKVFTNCGERPEIYFWRDQSMEVDLLVKTGSRDIMAIECKSAATPPSNGFRNQLLLQKIMKSHNLRLAVAYGGLLTQTRSQGNLISWKDLAATIIGVVSVCVLWIPAFVNVLKRG